MDPLAQIAQLRATQATLHASIAQVEAVIVGLQAEAAAAGAAGLLTEEGPPPCPTCKGPRGWLRAITGPDSIVCNRCGVIENPPVPEEGP